MTRASKTEVKKYFGNAMEMLFDMRMCRSLLERLESMPEMLSTSEKDSFSRVLSMFEGLFYDEKE